MFNFLGDEDEGKKSGASETDPLIKDSKTGDYTKESPSPDRRAIMKKVSRSSSMPTFSRRRRSAQGQIVPPSAALLPLITGGKLPVGAMTVKYTHPTPRIKCLPTQAPYPRRARHRSFRLRWLNEFRHWWKSSRLLVRLAGLYYIARLNWSEAISKKASLTGLDLARSKGPKLGLKLVKLLGHGGPMRGFLKTVQPFTRLIRIVVATWRWVEAAPCRRLEVGVEEATAFVGNRCSRIFARLVVDTFCLEVIFPLLHYLLRHEILWFDRDTFDPSWLIVILGIIRAVSPYGASFQGSRVGRIFTRGTFSNGMVRWLPTQRVECLNLKSEDCHEGDEVTEDAELLPLARDIAAALGTADHNHKIREALEKLGFRQMGCGAGGYGAYENPYCAMVGAALLLHVTPYGPSICDVLPMYIILEKEESADLRKYWSQSLASLKYSKKDFGPKALEGFAYQGAYFSNHHFAEMRTRYDLVMMDYSNACKYMCKRRAKGIRDNFSSPPADLQSLKAFLETGKRMRDQWKTKRRMKQTQRRVKQLGEKITKMMEGRKDDAPSGVILYFEGLDCAGKSSTGNLIRDALLQSGYGLEMLQYNRPPTPEQKLRPWIDRFEVPVPLEGKPHSPFLQGSTRDVEDGGGSEQATTLATEKQHKAVIWDRGPAGDFVYGALAEADYKTREDRYREFLDFDRDCRESDILFFKLFFVTDRDAISRTLGKRLAHKKICQDLHIWLDSAAGGGKEIHREGLDEIDLHIDPTDFIAFNSYHNNLHKFYNFVRHTDIDTENNPDGFANPWVVVSTCKRHPARLALMKSFDKLLDTFHEGCCKPKPPPMYSDYNILYGVPKRFFMMIVYACGIVILYWYYFAHTFESED